MKLKEVAYLILVLTGFLLIAYALTLLKPPSVPPEVRAPAALEAALLKATFEGDPVFSTESKAFIQQAEGEFYFLGISFEPEGPGAWALVVYDGTTAIVLDRGNKSPNEILCSLADGAGVPVSVVPYCMREDETFIDRAVNAPISQEEIWRREGLY